jgi:tripartite-type tricarboxylate transporter receptor subunit TctC
MKNLSIIITVLSCILFFNNVDITIAKPLDFSRKPVRIIVPFNPGGGTDIQTRGIAPYVEKHLGADAKVIIEYKPGADTRMALNEVWKSVPDGHTMINGGFPSPTINQMFFPVKYIAREFTHIFAWSKDNVVLVVNSETWKTVGEFISAAQVKTMSCGIVGIGSLSTFTGIAFEEAANFKPVQWVPFNGAGPAMTALAGKHVDFGLTQTASAFPLIAAGKLRPLMVFSNEKDYRFPEVPTLREVGLNMSSAAVVMGVVAPPGLPQEVAKALELAFSKAVKEPKYLNWAQTVRTQVSPLNREQFLDYTIYMEKEIIKHVDKVKKTFQSHQK